MEIINILTIYINYKMEPLYKVGLNFIVADSYGKETLEGTICSVPDSLGNIATETCLRK